MTLPFFFVGLAFLAIASPSIPGYVMKKCIFSNTPYESCAVCASFLKWAKAALVVSLLFFIASAFCWKGYIPL